MKMRNTSKCIVNSQNTLPVRAYLEEFSILIISWMRWYVI